MFVVTFTKKYESGFLAGLDLECRISFPTLKLANEFRRVMEGKEIREAITGAKYVAHEFNIIDDTLVSK